MVQSAFRLDARMLPAMAAALAQRQPLRDETGAVHAAGWGLADGTVALVREDIGRHNALDKLLGALARQRTDMSDGVALLTSRASSEMVQKAATLGVPMVAAVSAPTDLAIRIAEDAGVTLVAWLRERGMTVYTHGARVGAPLLAETTR